MSEKYINSFIIKNAGEQEQEVRIKIPLEQVEGASDLKNEAEATARKLASLKEELEYQEDILTAQGVILKETITDTYNMRKVAGGLDIYDGSLAEVKKVEGKTIKSKNLVDEKNPSAKPNQWTYNNGIWQGINPHYQPLKFLLSVTEGKTYAVSLNLLNESTGTENRVLVTDGETTVLSQAMQEGLKRYEYLFTAKITGIYTVNLVGYGDGKNFYFNNLQVEEVEEGSVATEYEPYFEGLKHTTFGGIKSTGKNIWNSTWNVGAFNDSTGETISSSISLLSDFVEVSSGKYTFSGNITNRYGFTYDKNKKPLRRLGYAFNATITFTADEKYIRVMQYNSKVIPTNIQLELGSTATAYEPYIEPSILNFPKTELPIGATLDFDTKKATNYGVTLVFDGKESWEYSNSGGKNGVKISNKLPNAEKFTAISACISTDGDKADALKKQNTIGIGDGNRVFYWYGILDHLGFTTVDATSTDAEKAAAVSNFIAWIKQRYDEGNPVTVHYVSSTLQNEINITGENEYKVLTNGAEQIIGNDAAQWEVDLTLTQEYIVKPGGGSDGN